MANGWKITAIIFIVITTLLVGFIYYITMLGIEIERNDNLCSANICVGYETYIYDPDSKICYCTRDGYSSKEVLIGKDSVTTLYDEDDEIGVPNNYFS